MRPNQQYIFQGQGQCGGIETTNFVEGIWRIAPSGGKSNFSHDQHAEMMDFISSLTSSEHGWLEDMYYLEMCDFCSFLVWDRFFVDVIRVARIRFIFFSSRKFDRDFEWEPCQISKSMCSADIDARRKAKSNPEILNAIWTSTPFIVRYSMSVPRHASVEEMTPTPAGGNF